MKIRTNKKILLLVSLCAIVTCQLFSQAVTYSPYTIFGIGEIEQHDLGRNSGMGNVGIGLQSRQSLNRLNPASYSSLDSLTFTLEVSFSGKMSTLSNGSSQQKNVLANFKKLALGYRISKFWSMSAGIVPFSYTGYNINAYKNIEGTTDISTINLTGDGAINKIYTGHSFTITPNLSLGINLSFLFGMITHTEKLASYSSNIKRESYLHNMNLDYGIQYSNHIGDNLWYTVGGVFGLDNSLKLRNTVTLTNYGSQTTTDQGNYNSTYTLPLFYGAGFSIKNNYGFTLASDYRFQKWEGSNANTDNMKYANSRQYAIGIEYQPAIRIPKNYFQRMFYQVGYNYNQSYLRIRGNQINEYAFTAGIGLPIKGERTYFNISFETGNRGKLGNALFKETYNQINLNLVFRDFWFIKSKFD